MKPLLYASVVLVLIASPALLQTSAAGQTAGKAPAAAAPNQHQAMLNTYCVGCHNSRAKIGGLALDGEDLQAAADSAEIWERALRKLRGHAMPPPGSPQIPVQAEAGVRDVVVAFIDRSHVESPTISRTPSWTSSPCPAPARPPGGGTVLSTAL